MILLLFYLISDLKNFFFLFKTLSVSVNGKSDKNTYININYKCDRLFKDRIILEFYHENIFFIRLHSGCNNLFICVNHGPIY